MGLGISRQRDRWFHESLTAVSRHRDCDLTPESTAWLTKRAAWRNVAEVRACFSGTDKVSDSFVFDIGGNKLRLIAAVHFNTGKIFIRAVLTHREYDKGGWK